METTTFLEKTLGSEGSFCVFAFRQTDERRVQKFYTSIDAVVDAARNLDGEGYDVYFALGTLNEAGNRRVDNVKQLRAFFLDLDCGASKDFVSQHAAIKALRAFCITLKLPKPTMVNSGRGVHVYWPLTEPVCVDDWLPVASRLKNLCKQHGFGADPAVTADAARVLRVPYTHNYKAEPPAEVSFFGDLQPSVEFDKFSELLGADPIPVPAKYVPQGSNAVMNALAGNKENYFRDILVKTSEGKGCTQLAQIIQNQEAVSEPMWRAGLSIAKFCVDGDKAAHRMSKHHPEYDPHDTLKKLELIKGPYTCARFDEFNPDVCMDCPNWGKIKSPIVLGKRVAESAVNAEGLYEVPIEVEVEVEVEAPALALPTTPINKYTIPKYPHPYFRGVNGGVYIRTSNADGDPDEKCLYHNDLYVVKRIKDPEIGEAVVMRLHLPRDGVQEFTLSLSAVTSREEFRKVMSAQGVALMKMEELMSYTTTWINELQANSVAEEAHRQFGWTNDKCEAFILGNQKITATGIEFNPPSNQTVGLFPAFEPKGSLQGWRDTVHFWDRSGFELQQYVLGVGFGTALMQFANVHCAALHLYNKESGVGKTTCLAAAVGIWGQPEALIMQERDTLNTKMNRGEVYHNLVWPIDEITNMPPKQASDMLYQFTGGQQRARMTASSNAERFRGKPWRLMALTTGNTSVIERISTTKAMPKAEAQRILECRVPRIKFTSKAETDAFDNALHANYGHAGIVYVQYIMRNLESVKRICEDVQARVDKAAELNAENRFWSEQVSKTIAGLMVAQAAGLVDFDIKKVYQWAIKELIPQNKRSALEMNATVQDLLNDFFAENISYILQIKSTDDSRKVQGNGIDTLVIPEAVARGKLVARYETDTKLFFVKVKPLKEWCGELQINYGHLVTEIIAKCNGRRIKKYLTKGTHLDLPSADCIMMKFDVGDDDDGSGDNSDV
jgi:hypothetical protein